MLLEVNLTFSITKKKKIIHVIIALCTIALLGRGLFVSDAYAYLDPGSGSIIIQAIIGAFVGVGITLKIYWYKLKEKLKRH